MVSEGMSVAKGIAAGALVKGTIQEMALEPTMFYIGKNSLLNHIFQAAVNFNF